LSVTTIGLYHVCQSQVSNLHWPVSAQYSEGPLFPVCLKTADHYILALRRPNIISDDRRSLYTSLEKTADHFWRPQSNIHSCRKKTADHSILAANTNTADHYSPAL